MHQNVAFSTTKFSGEGTTSPRGEEVRGRGKPPRTPNPPRRLRRLDVAAFGGSVLLRCLLVPRQAVAGKYCALWYAIATYVRFREIM